MSTYGPLVARRDFRLVRGDSHRLGGHWRKRNVTTGVTAPVDLVQWSGVTELRSPSGVVWWSGACRCTEDGYAVADIPPNAFTGAVWAGRQLAEWRCTVTNKDKTTVKTLAWGYIHLSD